MDQETHRSRWGAAALAAAVVLSLAALAWGRPDGQVQTWGGAALELSRPEAVRAAAPVQAGSRVIPVGHTVGIKLFSDGVVVVGLSDLETGEGTASPARELGLKVGDVITHINGQEVDSIEAFQALLQTLAGQTMTLRVTRGERQLQLSGAAVLTQEGRYQLGAWIRDSMAGIGTMTFYDPASGTFAALGHGINDVDTAQLMPLQSGSIMYSCVTAVKKGLSGAPGSLQGEFDLTRDMGQLYANTNCGIFGTLTDPDILGQAEAVEVASRGQVRAGAATILSNIAGDEVKEYQVEITHIYPAAAGETRNLMLRVTDPELLEQTGGIVQGMSGSPILQDGRLVGAVTHVLVNDPTRGYGILAENMLSRIAWEGEALAG